MAALLVSLNMASFGNKTFVILMSVYFIFYTSFPRFKYILI
jgi:hypothetical protein